MRRARSVSGSRVVARTVPQGVLTIRGFPRFLASISIKTAIAPIPRLATTIPPRMYRKLASVRPAPETMAARRHPVPRRVKRQNRVNRIIRSSG